MLLSRHPKTGIVVIQKLATKLANNQTYNSFDGDIVGVATNNQPVGETTLFDGFCIVDDMQNNYSFDQVKQYGIQRGQGYMFYINYQQKGAIKKELLPELYVRYNQISNNTLFDLNLPYTELKITDIDTPNGILLKHIQLNCKTIS